jgi:hypothetical protein
MPEQMPPEPGRLTQEYLRMQRGLEPDWGLDRLRQLYNDIRLVNVGMATRVRQASKEDASVNAIIILAPGGEVVAYTAWRTWSSCLSRGCLQPPLREVKAPRTNQKLKPQSDTPRFPKFA